LFFTTSHESKAAPKIKESDLTLEELSPLEETASEFRIIVFELDSWASRYTVDGYPIWVQFPFGNYLIKPIDPSSEETEVYSRHDHLPYEFRKTEGLPWNRDDWFSATVAHFRVRNADEMKGWEKSFQ